jgi:hypothetical protein
MPRKFYADTNVIHLLLSTWGPEGFEERARAADCTLGLGIPVIYELARGFLFPELIQTAKRAFQLLSKIEHLEVLPTIDALIRAEFHLASTGIPLITVLQPYNRLLARQEILKLANGFTDDACQFISRRESDVLAEHRRIARANMELARDFLSQHPERRKQMKTFNGFRTQVLPTAQAALRDLAAQHGILVGESSLDRIPYNPERFPVLNTWLNAQWYIVYVAAMHENVPSSDKIDDFRHLVESALCDIFITNDADLVKRSRDIRPFKATSSWEDFKDWFGVGQWVMPMR